MLLVLGLVCFLSAVSLCYVGWLLSLPDRAVDRPMHIPVVHDVPDVTLDWIGLV